MRRIPGRHTTAPSEEERHAEQGSMSATSSRALVTDVVHDDAPRAAPPPHPSAVGWIENRAPSRWLPSLDVSELWRFRELAVVLAGRDLRVRYKQTGLGIAWAVLQPLVAAVIFSFVFGRLVHVPSEGIPYPVFVYAALLVWTYFATALENVAQSLVRDRELVMRTYFPRVLAPGAAMIPGLVDLAVSLVVLGVFMAVYGVAPGPELVLFPLWVLATIAVLLGSGLWLSALNVRYRDVRYTLTFLIQIWFFASPVVYPSSLVQGARIYVYALNPMVTVIDGARWSLVGGPAPGAYAFVSLGVTVGLLLSGAVYFLRAERRFADVI
jgi:homopolymeric O-antigen transport system permease protein